MFAREVPWWCGVDVTEENGLVRRGMICGKTPNGFFVNFGYSGHNKDFVPLQQCTSHRSLSDAKPYRTGDVVEALYQSAPDQPWRWHPAKFLAGHLHRFAFVAVNTGEVVVKKVLSVNAVRTVNVNKVSGSDIFLQYFEHGFDIPESGDMGKLASRLINTLTGARFVKIWSRETDTLGMTLEGGRLTYNCPRGQPLTASVILRALNRMATTYLSPEPAASPTVANGALDDLITAQLSLNVMDEIFSYLSSVQQVACRKVCQLWNVVLTSVASMCRVEIDITNLGYQHLATMLHENITKSTKILILSGGRSMEAPRMYHLHTVKTLLKAMSLRIRFIVLSGARVEACDLLDRWYSSDCDLVYHSKWRDVCGTLILNNVVVRLAYAKTGCVVVKKEVLDVQVDLVAENVLEKWCPVSGPDRDAFIHTRNLRLVSGCNLL